VHGAAVDSIASVGHHGLTTNSNIASEVRGTSRGGSGDTWEARQVGGDELARGREAAARGAWADAYTALSLADQATSLAGCDLELIAAATYLLGDVEECLRALQRGSHAYLDDGKTQRSARCVFWMAFILLLQGDLAQASGWLSRANRLLENERQECAEHGLLMLPLTVQAAAAGDYTSAQATAAQAAEIGARVGDPDLLALALHFHGRALVADGQVREGLALLDEAMVAVVAGEVWAPVAGNIYCSMIDACQEISDLRRAREWTSALETWWGTQPDMITFTGQCMIHRAEIMQLRGAWPEAIKETQRACERLTHAADQNVTGSARYRQAELYRAIGDFTAAEVAYRQASQWGYEPQPGLALLRLSQGNTKAAEAAIHRTLAETTNRIRRAKLLPALVEIQLTCGNVPAAREAANELTEIADIVDTPALRAAADHALAAVLLADDDARGAVVASRRAWQVWRELDAPYEAARVRVLVALCCRALGDEEAAALELAAAHTVFARLDAAPDLTRVKKLTRTTAAAVAHGLSPRELQVLRLVASGKTNHAIAVHLILADKTVDRHVTNILAKLGLSSRSAATAYAYEHRLL
jgi:DNA-binding CsgD family transcriptional regulator